MKSRYLSLDVFRGATVALMIMVNNPGTWSHIYAPLEHAPWHGCTPTDLVFPFFLFAVGNAMAFVLPRLKQEGDAAFWKKVGKRTLLILAIGILLNWFPFVKYDEAGNIVGNAWHNLRLTGVLQRIALCYFFASLIVYYFGPRGAFVWGAALLLGYWFLCLIGNPSDPYSMQGWFGTSVDKFLLGENHLYHGEKILFDPEGIASLPAAVVQVIFGYLCGHYILSKGKTFEMLTGLFVAGSVLVAAGLVWDLVFPVNKKIWTGSYTLYTTGLALNIIAAMVYLLDFKNAKGAWSRFFEVFGKNPLFIFAMSAVAVKALALVRIMNGTDPATGKPKFISPLGWFYEFVCRPLFSDLRTASLLYALCFIGLMWLLAYVLDRKRVYIKV